MDPILSLITPSDRLPPEALQDPVQSTPFFQVGAGGFLMRLPSGGRIHYAPGQGIALAEPENRPAGDLAPFVLTSGFAAAAWFDGRVPLSANAVQLDDGSVILIASLREDLHEAMALGLSEAFGLAVSDAPVVIDPEDATRICTNGQPITVRRTTKGADAPALREGARRLQLDRPGLDGGKVHACAGLISIVDGTDSAPGLEQLSLLHAVTEFRKHVFMPLVGTAIWGEETIGAAHLVLCSNLPILRYSLPQRERPTPELAADLMSQLNALGEG